MSKSGWVLAGLLLFTGACVNSEVTMTGARHPNRGGGCDIKIFPSTTPDYKWEDIATVHASCSGLVGRTSCIDELKRRTCDVGGDTLYGLKDSEDRNGFAVIGTVAIHSDGSPASPKASELAKTGDVPPKAGAEPTASTAPTPTEASCDPPCSPGYRCTEGQCLALCNPPCGDGMHCNQQRICETGPGR